MEKEELINKLNELSESGDTEMAHLRADKALLEYIDDEEISEAYNSWGKWYA